MKSLTGFLAILVALMVTLPAFGDDQQKAQKELNQLTAMARDFTGRTVVNLSVSQALNVPRATLVQQRSETGLNYGSLFLAGELVKSGATMPDISAKLKAGKTIGEIANEQHANWKQIAEDTKKLNAAVDTNLYNYFVGSKKSEAQDAADKYDPHYDGVKADGDDANDKEIDIAQKRYLRWKEQADKAKGDGHGLGLGDERIGYVDHHGGPGASGAGGQGQGGTANTNTGTGSPAGFGGPQ